MDNGVLPETITLVFFIFFNIEDNSEQVMFFCKNVAAPRVFLEVSDDDLWNFPKKIGTFVSSLSGLVLYNLLCTFW